MEEQSDGGERVKYLEPKAGWQRHACQWLRQPTRHNTNPAVWTTPSWERETAAGANRWQWHRHTLRGGPVTSHQPVGSTTLVLYRWPHDILTRMISLTATTPEVAIILALFGIKLKIVGIMASAPWSNLFPRTDDRCLQQERTSCSHILTHREAQRLSTVDSPPSQFS